MAYSYTILMSAGFPYSEFHRCYSGLYLFLGFVKIFLPYLKVFYL